MQFLYQRTLHLVTLLILSIALAACGGGDQESNNSGAEASTSSTQQSAAANEAGTTVNVIARDFEFVMDANTATAGTVSFLVSNEGSMPHDFAITINGERHQTSMLNPGQSESLTVDLEPGTYDYICTVPGHDILGMKGTFTVN